MRRRRVKLQGFPVVEVGRAPPERRMGGKALGPSEWDWWSDLEDPQGEGLRFTPRLGCPKCGRTIILPSEPYSDDGLLQGSRAKCAAPCFWSARVRLLGWTGGR